MSEKWKTGEEVTLPGYGNWWVAGSTLKLGQVMIVLSPVPPEMIPSLIYLHGIADYVMAPVGDLRKVE